MREKYRKRFSVETEGLKEIAMIDKPQEGAKQSKKVDGGGEL